MVIGIPRGGDFLDRLLFNGIADRKCIRGEKRFIDSRDLHDQTRGNGTEKGKGKKESKPE